MGYFLGHKIPERNPFWEEPEYQDQPDYWKWFQYGFDEGYTDCLQAIEPEKKVIKENEALRALIAANYRGMREEILKDIEEHKHTNT